jgi:hypothetical protein
MGQGMEKHTPEEEQDEVVEVAIRMATTLKVAQRRELAWRGRGRTRRECGKRLRSREGRWEGRRTSRRGCSEAKHRDGINFTDHADHADHVHESRTWIVHGGIK